MKKILLVGILLLAGVYVNAQNYGGKWFVSGAVGYDDYKTDKDNRDETQKQSTLKPAVGLFVSPTTAVGVELLFYRTKITIDYQPRFGSSDSHSVGFAPFIKRYWTIYNKFCFVGQASLPVLFGKTNESVNYNNSDYYNLSLDSDDFSIGLDLTPAIAYKASKHFTIEAGYKFAGLNYHKRNHFNDTSSTSFSIGGDTNSSVGGMQIGFKYIF